MLSMTVMMATAVVMLGIGLLQMRSLNYQAFVLLFGCIGAGLALQDIKYYRMDNKSAKQRISYHVRAMLGACIATITAVLVVNVHTEPELFIWVLPTLCFIPIFVYWKKKGY